MIAELIAIGSTTHGSCLLILGLIFTVGLIPLIGKAIFK